MYHWYLLSKEMGGGQEGKPQPSHFTAGGGPKWRDTVPDQVRTRLFLLGAAECLPLALGLVFGGMLEPGVSYPVTVACGVILTALLCLALRRFAPPTMIHIRPNGSEVATVARH